MYCKHCGKEITEDSKFCRHCGGKLDDIEQDIHSINDISKPESDEKEKSAISIKVTQKSKDNSAAIANEIVGNLKMIGLAIVPFVVYMVTFVLIHQKDITKYDYETKTSFLGESCYDPSTITGSWKFHWEEYYYELLYFELHNQYPLFVASQSTPERCLKDAKILEKEWKKKKEYIDKLRKEQPKQEGVSTQLDLDAYKMEMRNLYVLKEQAKEQSVQDIRSWNEAINSYRKHGYEVDLKKNALYSSLICLLLTIVGRYLMKLIRWIKQNKTNNHEKLDN